MRNSAIGGYFELELPAPKVPLYPQAMCFQSARAAFLALLRSGKPKRVWIPYYICGTMLASLKQAAVEPVFYKIDDRFHIAQEIHLNEGDWLLYVNYFGIRSTYAKSLLFGFDRKRIIIDASQALFFPPHDCLATIYSPRKFLGVPDGGMIVSSIPINTPELVDGGSFERARSLLERIAFSPEAGYAEHQCAEKTLFDQQPKRMSDLTSRILSSVDYGEVCRIRNQNFAYLQRYLGRYNLLQIDPGNVNGPLCYPLLTKCTGLREFLIQNRIFVATYWQDVLELVDDSFREKFLVHGVVPLPCDQRYGALAMTRIAEICSDFLLRDELETN